MDKDIDNVPLAQSNVSLRLAEIQRRCTELLRDAGDDGLELTLEEPIPQFDDGNPYNHG